MIDLNNIRNYTICRPEGFTVFGSAKEFDALPDSYKDQILFLDEKASKYLWSFSRAAHIVTGGGWAPFERDNFKVVEEFWDFRGTEESKQLLKKWLYRRGIAFPTWVYLLQEGNEPAIITTWKMIIKFAADIFIMGDIMVFDNTLNWCLYYFHEDRMFFGKDNIYDATADYKYIEALNERKKKYPQFKHPYL